VHSTIPGKEERILETEMQAGPRRQDAGTVCRQYVVDYALGAIPER
jgi:hypothetical protein